MSWITHRLKRCTSAAPNSLPCLCWANPFSLCQAAFTSSCFFRISSASGWFSWVSLPAVWFTSFTRSSWAARSVWNSSNFFCRTSTCSRSWPSSSEVAIASCNKISSVCLQIYWMKLFFSIDQTYTQRNIWCLLWFLTLSLIQSRASSHSRRYCTNFWACRRRTPFSLVFCSSRSHRRWSSSRRVWILRGDKDRQLGSKQNVIRNKNKNIQGQLRLNREIYFSEK